ncbi:hypothetical protein CYY_006205 [Polysphondylium violaceum]|uniref:SAYSvFN domain-containing protein n=1 Tax=Polysphondylium violaceum TaxID=133409 RepID=A0A8J4PRQ4_9MYCE|nr:hypothetical protein CYY_006205 [Polysphondylium violaceum]
MSHFKKPAVDLNTLNQNRAASAAAANANSRTVIRNGQIRTINTSNKREMDDVDIQFHYFFTKDNLVGMVSRNKWLIGKILIWMLVQYFFIKYLEFGAMFFLATCVYLIVKNLGTREKGTLSAYSVFNKNNEAILGSVSRDQLEGQFRNGGM